MTNSKRDQMTSRERVLEAFSHKETDRVPINFMSNAELRKRLMKHFRLKEGDNEGLFKALGVDFRGLSVPYKGKALFTQQVDEIKVDPLMGFHSRWVSHESGGYWDYCDFPLKRADVGDIEKWPFPSPDDFDYSQVQDKCEKYKEYALYYGGDGLIDIMNSAGKLFGMERVYMAMALEDKALMQYIDKKLEMHMGITKRALEMAQGGISFIWMGEDLGTQRGPLMSLESYQEIIRPRHEKFIKMVKEYHLPVLIHSCGSSSWAFDDFIEMGINVVSTLQPEAKDMSPSYIKEKYGNSLAFHGCISTAGPVAYGTVDDVEKNVRETLEIMMPQGGFCLAPTHALQDNSPTENVLKMYESANEYGWYK
jgi:uroporphyrinogen decarboxylase